MSYPPAAQWVDTAEQLQELIDVISGCERIGLDTEFHGERTYIPRLMLLQVATEDAIFLVDPLADLDLCALFSAIAQPDGPLLIGHALHNDLEIVFLRCHVVFPRVFDTQVAASFLGHGLQVGLSSLVHRVCGERLPKDGQMADWSRRPLSDKLCKYAANDVRYLLEIHDHLTDSLRDRGRASWVVEECARLGDQQRYERDPAVAYKRVSKYRTLKPGALGILAALAAERDALAAELDMVPHFVVPDDILMTMARSKPTTRAELSGHRRLNHRHVSRHAERWLAAVRRGMEAPLQLPSARPPAGNNIDSASSLVMLLVNELARTNDLAPQLLMKRAKMQTALQDGFSDKAKMLDALGLSGWRADLVGEPVWKLLAGEIQAACLYENGEMRVVFEGREGVFLEVRPAVKRKRRRRSRRRRGPKREDKDPE